jgi:predicted metal-dependent peptidase
VTSPRGDDVEVPDPDPTVEPEPIPVTQVAPADPSEGSSSGVSERRKVARVRPMGATPLRQYRTARALAIRRYPYLARSLGAMTPLLAEGLGTFAVDRRWRIYLDPECLQEWTLGQAAAVIVHENMHLVRAHADRGAVLFDSSDQGAAFRWNLACDAAINDDISVAEFQHLKAERRLRAQRADPAFSVQLPGSAVVPESAGLEPGGLEEDYYRKLSEVVTESDGPVREYWADPNAPGPLTAEDLCGSGSGVVGGNDSLAAQADELGESHRGLDERAAVLTRARTCDDIRDRCARHSAGDVPAGLLRWADEVAESVTPWVRELRRVVGSGVRSTSGWQEPTYMAPSRRSTVSDSFIRPGSRSWVSTVAVVVDTSGSMSRELLGQALGELRRILGANRRGRTVVYSCDTALTRLPGTRSLERLAEHLRGGGGTDMGRAIEQVARPARGIDRPDLIIVLTDGGTPWPETPSRCPVIAVIIDDPGAWYAVTDVPPWIRAVKVRVGGGSSGP